MNDSTTPRGPSARASAVKVVVEQWDDLVAAIVATTPLSHHDAEDVLAAFAADVWAGTIVISAAPESWLAYIKRSVRNRALNKARDDERAQRRVEDMAAEWELRHKDLINEGIAAREVFLDALTDLRRLPEHEREVFLLRYWDDLSHAEIATHTGLSADQVDKRLQQAKDRLAKMRKDRESSEAYGWLALVLQPVTRHDSSVVLGSPVPGGVVSFAAAVAFSLAAATGGSVPADEPRTYVPPQARASTVSQRSSAHEGSGPLTARRLVGGRLADSADPKHPSKRLADVGTSRGGHVCVGDTCLPGGSATAPADVLVVPLPGPVESVTYREDYVPVCRYVPAQPVAECRTEGEPNYLVDPPPVAAQ